MESLVVSQIVNEVPPRKGATIALAIDATGRAYDLTGLTLGGKVPAGSNTAPQWVCIEMQAETADVYFHFASDNTVTLDNTAVIAVGNALAFANTYGGVLKFGIAPLKFRISRKDDKYLVVKTSAGTATLRIWASSEGA